MANQKIKTISIDKLHLWTENPRDPISSDYSDFEIISRAITDDKKKWNLGKMVAEMGAYYDLSELPTVVKVDGKYIVYDGNRRVAALKYLQNKELYTELGGGFFFSYESTDFGELKELPCNVCDLETALNNVERKHTLSGTWKTLERDYFLHLHRGKEKSIFIWIDEQTGIISSIQKMNQRFVKDEMLSKTNLEEIGFMFNPETGITSNYSQDESDQILLKIIGLVEDGIVSTRKNRQKLKEPLLANNPELNKVVSTYDSNKEKRNLSTSFAEKPESLANKARKTPTTIQNQVLFGQTLQLKSGKVNDIYRAIVSIYEKDIKDDNILPIIGMSLRLILEIGARVYYKIYDSKKSQEDKLYGDFLKLARKQMNDSKETENFFTLTEGWLNKQKNMEGILSKYAHGNILTSRTDILLNSRVIGNILEFYFGK